MKETIYEDIVEMIKSICGKIGDDINIDDNFKEKGIDSLEYIQLLVLLEERYNFVFEDEMLVQDSLSNIEALIEYILKMI